MVRAGGEQRVWQFSYDRAMGVGTRAASTTKKRGEGAAKSPLSAGGINTAVCINQWSMVNGDSGVETNCTCYAGWV
jgi:hypothetical protein